MQRVGPHSRKVPVSPSSAHRLYPRRSVSTRRGGPGPGQHDLVQVTGVNGHHLVAAEDANLLDCASGGHLVEREGRRHRVVIAVETHEREPRRRGVLAPPDLEGLGRQRQHCGEVAERPFRLGAGLAPHVAEQVGEAAGRR